MNENSMRAIVGVVALWIGADVMAIGAFMIGSIPLICIGLVGAVIVGNRRVSRRWRLAGILIGLPAFVLPIAILCLILSF